MIRHKVAGGAKQIGAGIPDGSRRSDAQQAQKGFLGEIGRGLGRAQATPEEPLQVPLITAKQKFETIIRHVKARTPLQCSPAL